MSDRLLEIVRNTITFMNCTENYLLVLLWQKINVEIYWD